MSASRPPFDEADDIAYASYRITCPAGDWERLFSYQDGDAKRNAEVTLRRHWWAEHMPPAGEGIVPQMKTAIKGENRP